jgi:nicotinate-nucleotide adenylyltransferase
LCQIPIAGIFPAKKKRLIRRIRAIKQPPCRAAQQFLWDFYALFAMQHEKENSRKSCYNEDQMIVLHPGNGPSFADMRIGLLGGSFNPAHAAHLAMSLHAMKCLELDQIWWLVSPHNPLKPKKDMAPLETRITQARKLAHHPKIIVTDIETKFGMHYTIDTLRALRARFPRAHFVWLMGADNLSQISRWRRWPDIFAAMPVAVFRRPGHALNGKAATRFAKFRHSARCGKKFANLKPPAWLVFGNRLHLLSATAIRKESENRRRKTGG